MKKYLCFLAFLLGTGGFAQTYLDSLWGAWLNEDLADTIRLSSINDMAMNGFVFSQPDSAFTLAEIQYDYAEKIGNRLRLLMAR